MFPQFSACSAYSFALLSTTTEIFISSLLLQEHINFVNLTQKRLAYRLGFLIIFPQAYHPPFVLQTCASCILMAALVVYKGFCEYDNYGFLNKRNSNKNA